jgi:hypothetical protein
VVSLFNWSDQPTDIQFTFTELGLNPEKEYLVYGFWNRTFLGAHKGSMKSHVDAQANILLAVHENLGRPQLLSTDRHISQGGVEWTDTTWNPDRKELMCEFKLVANDPLTAIIHVPSGYKYDAVKAEGATVETHSNKENVIEVVLNRISSGVAKMVLTFEATGK